MRVSYNEYLAAVYAESFSFPLSRAEMKKWAIGKKRLPKMEIKIDRKLVDARKKREEISRQKLIKLIKLTQLIKEISTIEAIFVTGSVAVLNATEDSDIDLMIVTKPGKLWRTRLKLLKFLKDLKLERNRDEIKDRICTNIFLDSDHLEIMEKNLYTAHEIVQAKCVFDRGGINDKWLVENLWVKEFLPNVKIKGVRRQKGLANSSDLIEFVAFMAQFIYMFPKMTKEKVGLGYAFFHPVSGQYYLDRFKDRLGKL